MSPLGLQDRIFACLALVVSPADKAPVAASTIGLAFRYNDVDIRHHFVPPFHLSSLASTTAVSTVPCRVANTPGARAVLIGARFRRCCVEFGTLFVVSTLGRSAVAYCFKFLRKQLLADLDPFFSKFRAVYGNFDIVLTCSVRRLCYDCAA